MCFTRPLFHLQYKRVWAQDYNISPAIIMLMHSFTVGCLGPNDLRRVQNSCWEARTQWYNIGLDLDLTPDSLDAIELAIRIERYMH